jgi:PAS domain S-box-containing protein
MLSDGRQVWLRHQQSPLHDINGRVVGVMGTFEDITQRKLAEEQIHKLYRAVEQSLHTIIIADASGNIEYVNPRFCDITGFSKEDIMFKNLRELTFWEMSDQEYHRFWEVISSGKDWQGKMQSRKKGGDVFWVSGQFTPIRNPVGQITHFLGVFEDITERIRAEEKIIHMAYYDPLTIAPTARSSTTASRLRSAHAQRQRQMLAVMFVDLDRFRNSTTRWPRTSATALCAA